MDNTPTDWGHFELTLERYLKQKGFSKHRLAERAKLQKTQLTAYCRNQVQRPDLHVLARICMVLECDIADILRYIPPKTHKRELQASASSRVTAAGSRDWTRSYRTIDLAREVDAHPNTIRFYENSGLIAAAERGKNGYRRFTLRHLYQIRICRCILGTVWTGRVIRASAMKVLEAVRDWDIDRAMTNARNHIALVEKEYAAALETIAILKQWADGQPLPETGKLYTRKETAALIGVTPEILRNWERNGLLATLRSGANRTRIYRDADIARLRIIYMLRQTNYSISAIHRSLTLRDRGNTNGAIFALNKPEPDEEIPYTSAGDHWLEALSATADLARKMIVILEELKK